MRVLKVVLSLIAIAGAVAFCGNWYFIDRIVQQSLSQDARNDGIYVRSYLDWGINPKQLVIDLRALSGKTSIADVDRMLFTTLEALKDYNFDKVVLAYQGSYRFQMRGAYAKQIGEQYAHQNPIYTMRTMQENIYRLDGSPAFDTWTGGLLGVLGKQLEDHNEFHRQWYISAASR